MVTRITESGDFNQSFRLYALLLLLAAAGIFLCLERGKTLAPPPVSVSSPVAVQMAPHVHTSQPQEHATLVSTLARNSAGPLSRLFLQIGLVIGGAWILGAVFQRFGQPAVIGEMVAGILLGPSFFGLIGPRAFEFVFAPSSLESLRLFSQLGVCLFMFAVGMELNVADLRHRAPRLLVVGHGGIAIPYVLGVVLALFLFGRYAEPGTSYTAFALFMGISMSITAFPMLVRILKDRGLFHTRLGNFATLCAAMGDASAWCILAIVVSIAGAADLESALMTLGLVAIYGLVMLFLFRPVLSRLLAPSLQAEAEPDKGVLALVLAVVLISSFIAEVIGIHALFGAFLAGLIMPAGGGFRRKLILRLEHFASVLLLPLFFAFIGLRTQIGLLRDPADWWICGAIILVATVGKLGGTAILARMMKFPWRDALQLGALMNTRGLMELIALNIGYDMGILSLRIFTMLVLMAILTTMLTGPLVTLFAAPTARR